MSSLVRPDAAVRMITPPTNPCSSRNSRTMPRSLRALFARFDFSGNADVVDRRHEDEEPAGHRDVRGEAGALGAERFLDDLDENFLAFLEEVLDPRLRAVAIVPASARGRPRGPWRAVRRRDPAPRSASASPPPPASTSTASGISAGTGITGALVIVSAFETVELGGSDDLRDVEERVALEAYVNKGGLHAGQDFRDPALVDVADDTALILALDEDLDDLVVLEDRDTRVVPARGDDHLLVHGKSSAKAVTTPARPGRAGAGVAADEPREPTGEEREQEQRHQCQFVKRRIRTLRMSPKVAIVAIRDDPP